MSQYLWGKAFKLKFYPTLNREPLNLYSQTPAIYIFDGWPGRSSAADGTGAIQSITTWTEDTVSPYCRLISVTAIDDPSPTSTTAWDTYYIAINYRLEAGGQIQTYIRSFEVSRSTGASEIPGCSKNDLIAIYPAITAYTTDIELDEFLRVAQDQVRSELEAKGYTWDQILDLDRLALPVAYKTIQLVALSQVKEADDRFAYRHDKFEQMYLNFMEGVKLFADNDQDGEVDVQVEKSKDTISIR